MNDQRHGPTYPTWPLSVGHMQLGQGIPEPDKQSVPTAKNGSYAENNGRSIPFHISPTYILHPNIVSVLEHEANGHA